MMLYTTDLINIIDFFVLFIAFIGFGLIVFLFGSVYRYKNTTYRFISPSNKPWEPPICLTEANHTFSVNTRYDTINNVSVVHRSCTRCGRVYTTTTKH